eukprot:67413_1
MYVTGGYAGDGGTIYPAGLDGVMDVYCTGSMACYRFTIEAETMSGDLNVFCNGTENNMCNAIEVYGTDMTGDLYFECNPSVPQGCASAKIFCPETLTSRCKVYCSGREGNECQNVDIVVMDAQYVNEGQLDLICEGSGSCYYLDIKCGDDITRDNVGYTG